MTDIRFPVLLDCDALTVDGRRLSPPGGRRLLMMHKPPGTVCGPATDRHRSVLELVPDVLRHPDLAPLGRLDADTTGLLLLATDGAIDQVLLRPGRVEKAYAAAVDAIPARLGDTMPARFEVVGNGRVRVVVTEGSFHLVKKLLGHRGARVTALHRERIGPLRLDPALPPGGVRALTADERAALAALPRGPVAGIVAP